MAKHKAHNHKNKRGTKKGDKIHGKKAGKSGEVAQYITRAQALTKLQIPLADFRKLCILKGIYPRDPKRKNQGLDKTYYHTKDISFLSHEPLLNKFLELRTFLKKFKKLLGRNEHALASGFEERKPKYNLQHLVRERYPSFDDAVHDLDDAVSMIALFQALSADQKRGIPTEAVQEATRLYEEFQLFAIRAQALRKVFVSIKGYYFQLEVMGHTMTWLAPHQFAQALPADVDFRVMLTFLEFYRTMLKFVNFRLYADLGIAYPPKRDSQKKSHSAEVAALEVEMLDAGKAREERQAEDGDVAAELAADFGEASEEARAMQEQLKARTRMKTVFKGLRVFINREVPLRPVYFVLLCGGALEVGWERGGPSGGSPFQANSGEISHHVVDRPPDQIEQHPGREYVQPQWVFDSFNTGCQLPIASYRPGRTPPPHLSPFVDDHAEGYVPRQREILDKLAAEAGEGGAVGSAAQGGGGPAAAALTAEERQKAFAAELSAEAGGERHPDFEKRKAAEARARAERTAAGETLAEAEPEEVPRPTETEEERLRRKALLPKKHKRLLQRIEKGQANQKDASERLQKKRKLAEAAQK